MNRNIEEETFSCKDLEYMYVLNSFKVDHIIS